MSVIRWPAAVVALIFACVTAAAGPTSRPAMPPSAIAAVPQELLDKLDGQAQPPDPAVPPEKAVDGLEKGLKVILQLGAQAEKDYASAPNLYLVRRRMLQAADMLRRMTGQRAHEKEALEISHRILGSDCPVELKAQADWFVTRAKMREGRLQGSEAAEEIRKFAARYADSNAAGHSLAYAAILARQAELKDLANELADKLQANSPSSPEALVFLRRFGRHPDVGRPFEAELTRLDGTKLSLPKDLGGKVVVIDFWASWCGDCVEQVPHMKKVYDEYAPKGVEFVGISMDRTKAAVEKFIRQNRMTWIQTYDGPGFPAAQKYGIEAHPSVWVVGRDGGVLSDDAAEKLERILDGALSGAGSSAPAAPATAPSGAK